MRGVWILAALGIVAILAWWLMPLPVSPDEAGLAGDEQVEAAPPPVL